MSNFLFFIYSSWSTDKELKTQKLSKRPQNSGKNVKSSCNKAHDSSKKPKGFGKIIWSSCQKQASSRSTVKDQTSRVENMVRPLKFTKLVVYTKLNGLLPFTDYQLLSNPGLEIWHLEKNSRRKTQNLRKKLDNSRVKHKDNWILPRKSKICWLNSIFCFN